jgi:hypothetical protein
MKYLLLTLLSVTVCTAYAQNVGIGTKNPQNKLHVAGGIRIDTLANQIDSGIAIHNKLGVVSSLKFTGKKSDVLRGDGSFASASLATDAWLLGGNAGTDSNLNFLGTTDDKPLRFRINNKPFGSFGKNISLGNGSMLNNRSVSNIGIGNGALGRVIASNENIAIGYGAMQNYTGDPRGFYSSSGNLALGTRALAGSGDGDNNTAIGYEALRDDRKTSDLTAIGHAALQRNDGGARNTAVGFVALQSNYTGSGLTAVGWGALAQNGLGSFNTAIGAGAMGSTLLGETFNDSITSGNTATGYLSLFYCSGANNTATGAWSLHYNTSGQYNVANGYQALMNNTAGSDNEAFGYKVLFSNTTGSFNTGTGFRTMYFNTTGSNNTGSGFQALNTNTTGSNNTALGYYADVTTGNLSNATAIGYNTKVNASNKVRIGNASVTKIEGQVPFTTPSDGRYKFNVQEDVKGLSFIMKLRPVTYQFDVNKFDKVDFNNGSDNVIQVAYNDAMQIRRTGFIAQEVEVAANASSYDFSGIDKPLTAEDHYSLSYESFVVPLVKGMQEQQRMIEKLQTIVKHQQDQIDELTRKNK